MTSEPQTAASKGMSRKTYILLLLALVVIIDVAAFFVAPPFDKKNPDGACVFPVCFINGNLELPAAHAVWRLNPDTDISKQLVVFDIGISSTIVTMWAVSILVILLLFAMTRGRSMIPGRAQNAIEHV